MERCFLDAVPSTHQYVLDALKGKERTPPFLVYAKRQTQGIGSRGNSWQGGEGNLFLTLCVEAKQLPDDLHLASTSIYFGMLAKEVLQENGSKTWVKWPNDLYVESKKIGGVMSIKTGEAVVVSMGINFHTSPPSFGVLDIPMSPEFFVERLQEKIAPFPLWKNIFSKYKLEFEHSRYLTCHIGGESVSLEKAFLCDDGSIQIGNKKVYSLR